MASRSPNPVISDGGKRRPDDVEKIRLQLERVLSSYLFRGSRRCQGLLRHVAERTLAGESAALKERTLGVEVFGRPPAYDTNQDPIVRATASEVRKKLAQYYQEPEHASELRISLPPGSYSADFQTIEEVAPSARARKVRSVLVTSAAATALIASATVLLVLLPRWSRTDVERTGVEQFWRPMLDAPGSVLFCLGQPHAYDFRSEAFRDHIENLPQGPPAASLPSLQKTIPLRELVPMWGRYICLGDAACLVRLTALFEKRGKPYHIRGEKSTSFSDLREQPSVLIGAFDNQWTLRAVGQLRYTFIKDYSHGGETTEMVRDRDHPEKTDWKLTNDWPDWNIPNDYAIVSRVLDLNTDRMVVVAAGITEFGTMGAGEFLASPEYFSEVLPQLPRDWQKRNLQIVLRVPVVHGVSGHPHVLATYVW